MYMHVSSHKGVKFEAVSYIFEDPPHILDGTVNLGAARDVYETLRGLAEVNDTLFLCTVSLPAGMDINDQDAILLMRQALRDRGIEPDAVPYVLGKHVQSAARHFHLIFINRTFAGFQVMLDTSQKTTQASDRATSLAFGLEPTIYFDPDAMPTFSPPIIKRRVENHSTAKERSKSRSKGQVSSTIKDKLKALNKDLLCIFEVNQPKGLAELNANLNDMRSVYVIQLIKGAKQGQTYATTCNPPIFLNQLGPAWFKKAVDDRFDFAALLSHIRPLLLLRILLRLKPFSKDIFNDQRRRHEPTVSEFRSNARSATGPDRSRATTTDTSFKSVDTTDERGRDELDRTPVPAPRRASGGASGVAERVRQARSANPSGIGGGGGRLTPPSGWLAVLCRAAREFGGRLVKLRRHKRLGVRAHLHFTDGGASIHSKSGGNVLRQSPSAEEFVKSCAVKHEVLAQREVQNVSSMHEDLPQELTLETTSDDTQEMNDYLDGPLM